MMRFIYFLFAMVYMAGGCINSLDKSQMKVHPVWLFYNENEKDILPQNQCIVTKVGCQRIRFQVPKGQTCFNAELESCIDQPKEGGIAELKSGKQTSQACWPAYLLLTPTQYGVLDTKLFNTTTQKPIKHEDNMLQAKKKEAGLPKAFFEDLKPMIGTTNLKEMTIILSTGIRGRLDVSDALHKALQDAQKNGQIKGYIIDTTIMAIKRYNRLVQKGVKACILIYTEG